MNVCVEVDGDIASDISENFIQLLEKFGVAVDFGAQEYPDKTVLLLFSQVSESLLKKVTHLSRFGRQQLIALACASVTLGSEELFSLLKMGSADVIEFNQNDETVIESIVQRIERWNAIENLLGSDLICNNLIGSSEDWRLVLKNIIEVSCFSKTPILLVGETGTGKEQLARLVHTLNSTKQKKKLVTLDCSTLVPELSGSEFFGHERGSFTGATEARDGCFSLANQGTLFLDEIGELPLHLQAQLLRVIQEQSYKRLGSNQWRHTDFRLICATNKDLEQEVQEGRFRSDLYYRIAGWVCKLPPLRDRREDIPLLARYFFQQLSPDHSIPDFSPYVNKFLLERHYPGNIRELKQLMSRIYARHVGYGEITIGDLPSEEWASNENQVTHWKNELFIKAIRQALERGAELKEISNYASELAIDIVVSNEQGNLQRAAKKLGVTDRALQMRRANRKQ